MATFTAKADGDFSKVEWDLLAEQVTKAKQHVDNAEKIIKSFRREFRKLFPEVEVDWHELDGKMVLHSDTEQDSAESNGPDSGQVDSDVYGEA